MNLGFAFRELRHRKFPHKEKKQYEVAESAGISQTFLSQIESGDKVPSMDVVTSLCKVYGVPPVFVFWLATELKDIKKNKQEAYKVLREPMNNLILEYL